jgi:O-antigen/teichoic acid export membrane protein
MNDNEQGRAHRFTHGAAATLLTQVINTVGQIALVPIFLGAWGDQLYGEWLTLSAAVAYMIALDFGMQNYVVNRLTQSYAKADLESYTDILHSALYWSLVITGGALGLVGVALLFAPLDEWFQFALTSRTIAAVVAALLAMRVLASIPQGLIAGIYRTIGEFPRGRTIVNLQRVFFFVLSIAVVTAGGGLRAVAAAQMAPLLAGVGYAAWDLRRRHPEIQLGVERRSLSLAFSLLAPSSLFFVIQLGMALTLQGSTLMVGAVLGSAAVAVFVTQRMLANLIRQVTSSITHALWPEITVLEVQRRYATLQRVHLLAVKFLLATSLAAAVFLHFGGRDLFDLWTRERVTYNADLMSAFLLLLVLQTPWVVSSTLLTATNHLRLLAGCYAASGALGLGLGYLLIGPWGAPGLVLGLLIADFTICNGCIPWAACRLIKQPLTRYALEIPARGFPVAAGVYVLTRWAQAWLPETHPVARLVGLGMIVAATIVPLSYGLWLSPGERRELRRLVRRT